MGDGKSINEHPVVYVMVVGGGAFVAGLTFGFGMGVYVKWPEPSAKVQPAKCDELTGEVKSLKAQIRELTQERDDGLKEIQRIKQKNDNAAKELQLLKQKIKPVPGGDPPLPRPSTSPLPPLEIGNRETVDMTEQQKLGFKFNCACNKPLLLFLQTSGGRRAGNALQGDVFDPHGKKLKKFFLLWEETQDVAFTPQADGECEVRMECLSLYGRLTIGVSPRPAR